MAPRPKLPTATADQFAGKTLMRVVSKNLKRIRFVDITLDAPLTLIGGDNDQGKSSLLDTIGWALRGKLEIENAKPIRNGTQEGFARCDFGDGKVVELSVTRHFQRVGESDWTDSVDIQIPGHVAPTRIEEFLRSLTDEKAIDPMAFDELKPDEQFDALQKLVGGFDFKQYATNRKKLFDERTQVGRDYTREKSAADAVVLTEEPPEPEDESALQAKLTDAGTTNKDNAVRRVNRDNARQKIADAKTFCDGLDERIEKATATLCETRDREIARLQALIHDAERNCAHSIQTETTRLRTEAEGHAKEATDLQTKLDSKPEPVDVETAPINESLTRARAAREKRTTWANQKASRDKHVTESTRQAERYAALTKQIDDLDAAKTSAIESAKLPVDGIGFGEGCITLQAADGSGPVPWHQASTAIRMGASFELAMALQPKLRVILIRNGSNIGRTIRERIQSRAAEAGYRVLMEVVEEGGATQVVLENGTVKGATANEVKAVPA